jgi:outer membrane protein assembly factor BamD (BamD/ComL family)
VPVDGVLMRLGRVYLDAGKKSDAEQTFNRLVEEFPDSPFSGDARRELDQLKKT